MNNLVIRQTPYGYVVYDEISKRYLTVNWMWAKSVDMARVVTNIKSCDAMIEAYIIMREDALINSMFPLVGD